MQAPTKAEDKDFDPNNLPSSNPRETRSKTKEISKTFFELEDHKMVKKSSKAKINPLKITGRHKNTIDNQNNASKIDIEEPKTDVESKEKSQPKVRGRTNKKENEKTTGENFTNHEIKDNVQRETRSKHNKLEQSKEKTTKDECMNLEKSESDQKQRDRKPKKIIKSQKIERNIEIQSHKNTQTKVNNLNEEDVKKQKHFQQYAQAIEKLQEYALPDSIPCREEEKKIINDFLLEGLQSQGSNQTLCKLILNCFFSKILFYL